MTKDESLLVSGRITEFLEDAVKSIAQRAAAKDRPLDIDEQYAVRIIRSRQRRIWNEHDAFFDEDPVVRARAVVACQLKDIGDLLTFAHIHHARGRLDCTGCDFVYVGTRRDPQCVLCPRCNRGVMHVRTLYGPAHYDEPRGQLVLREGHIVRYSMCDECHAKTIVPVDKEDV